MKAKLEKQSLLEALERLGSEKQSGVLHLTGGSHQIKIYLDRGSVILITATAKEAQLGELLIRKKLLSTEQLDALLQAAKKEKQPLLHLMVKKKLATHANAEKLLAFHTRQVLSLALAWPGGTYEFKPAPFKGNLGADIRYGCWQAVNDIKSEAPKPPETNKAPAEKKPRVTGPALKKTIMQKMKSLPPTLQTVIEAKKLLVLEEVDFERLERILKTDQSLAATILKIANSAYYGLSGKIGSLKHAISMLGLKTLSQVITMAGTGHFLNQAIKGYGMTARQIHDHSLSVGLGSKSLAARVNPAHEEDVFVAGLLHDAGKIMLNPYLDKGQLRPEAYRHYGICNLEKQILECDHTEIAAEVFAQWLFPDNVVEGIRFHHNPEESGDNNVAYILNAADVLAKVDPEELPLYEIHRALDNDVADFLGLEQEDIAALFMEIKELEKSFAESL